MTQLKKTKRPRTVVVKSNDLINARFNLSVAETRIILLMVSQINIDDEDFKTYRVRIRDFMESAGISANTKNVYSRAREYTKKLMKRVLEIPKQDGTWLQVSFISSAEYPAGKGFVELQFDPKLKPYLIQLKQRFTTYEAQNVLALGSFYSIRVYELLKQYEKIGKRVISVEGLKDMLGLLDSYKSYYLFKKRVIEQAKKELDEHCDITFEYREIRVGRKIDKIEFNIIRQPEVINEQEAQDVGDIQFETVSADKKTLEAALKKIGLTPTQIGKAMQTYEDNLSGLADMVNQFMLKNEKGKIANLAAYLWDVIKVGGTVKNGAEEAEIKKLKEKERIVQKQKERKAAEERKLIAAWRDEYEKELYANYEKFADEGMENIGLFEDHVKKNMGLRIMLMKEGKLNRKHKMFRYMLGSFVAEKQGKELAEFPDWVLDVKGFHITEDKNNPETFKIASQQASLFQ
jgi:plasmid replication initiation protein